jgi:hypothetical protein
MRWASLLRTKMKFRLALVLFAMNILVSCSRTPSSVLDDPTCDVPCWKGIVVGETSKDEALEILKQIPEIQNETFRLGSTDVIGWNYQGVRESDGALYFGESKVIVFLTSFDPRTSLKEFINVFGEPSFVYVRSSFPGFYTPMLVVTFVYPEKGVCLHHQPSILSTQAPKNYTISTRVKISRMYIVDPSIPNGQLKEGCLRGLDEDTYNKYVREWTGYGKYEVFVPGMQEEQ